METPIWKTRKGNRCGKTVNQLFGPKALEHGRDLFLQRMDQQWMSSPENMENQQNLSKLMHQFTKKTYETHLGVSIVIGIPNSWMVYFMVNCNLKRMMTGGIPLFLETSNSIQ